MKKILSLLVLVAATVNAQYSIKGTMTPPEKSDWVMLHKLQGIKPKYIANTTIKFDTITVGADKQILGKFSFKLPKGTESGAYRITYKNKGGGFIDFLFNKENIEFIFNPKFPDESVVYTNSRENKLYSEYVEKTAEAQKKVSLHQVEYLQSASKESKKAYKKELKALNDLQESYENKSEGMLAHSFIKASKKYNPSSVTSDPQEYMEVISDHFFKYVDFEDKTLYNSSYLVDKIDEFVFYSNYSEDQITQQKLYKKSIAKVMEELPKKGIKKEIIEYLATRYAEKRNSEIVDWLFSEYYDELADKNEAFKAKKLDELSVSVGRQAPDFSWKEGSKNYQLSQLKDGKNYLMIFWSTGCPHCVREVPEVHGFMKKHNATSVISFAIENNVADFNKFKPKLGGWHNVVGTHPEFKFDNEVVRKYKINATPTYFVLNEQKKIIAVPNTIEDVKKFFETLEQ